MMHNHFKKLLATLCFADICKESKCTCPGSMLVALSALRASYFSLLVMTAIPGRKEIKPVYHLSTHPTSISKEKRGKEREET